MAKLTWDEVGERFYETGVDQGVLYKMDNSGAYQDGVNWDGLTSVDESPEGAEANDIYADNIKYLSLISAEKYKCTINAYQSPEEFDECDGSAALAKGVTVTGQSRRSFGFSYRSRIGNDIQGDDYGYVIHLVYNCKCSPSQRTRSTVNDSPEAVELSWEVNSTPVMINAIDPNTEKPFRPTSHLQIKSTDFKTAQEKAKLQQLEGLLYGKDATQDRYVAVTPEAGDNPASEGWYELVEGSYVASEDVTVDDQKTYYEKIAGTAASDPTLPTPDEVLALLNS